MSSRSAAACLLAWLLLTPIATAQSGTDHVAGQLGRAIRECPQVGIFDDIVAQVDGTSVLLTGKVTAGAKKDEIERRVARIDGVHEVRNEIAVLPPLSSDDELRHRVARAIYGNPTFWSYAARSNPPIHIIVERGRVTLEGVVANEVDRTMAYSIASSFQAFAVKNDLKTEAEVKAELERL